MKTKSKAVKAKGGAMSAFVEKIIPKSGQLLIRGGNGSSSDNDDPDWVGTGENNGG